MPSRESSEHRPQTSSVSFDGLTVEQISTYTVGDVFLGGARRLLEPLILFDVEHRGFLGLHQELDARFRYGYEAYYYELRTESHIDFTDEGNYGGQARPTVRVGSVPNGIAVATESVELLRWLIQEGAEVLGSGHANPEESNMAHFEWLRDELALGRLAIDEEFSEPTVTTEVRVYSEERFRAYLLANPDDNVAVKHPPTAKEYL